MKEPRTLGADDRYRILSDLGAGGMGEVYRAQDAVLNRVVAIKFLSFGRGRDRELRRRFHREALVLSGLRHPNLVTIYEMVLDVDRPYIVQEFVEGDDLGKLMKKGEGWCGHDEVRRMGEALADVLAYLHDNGVLHRDIKPENVILCGDGRPRLVDFGLSLYTDATRITEAGFVLGTPSYLPPEVLRGGPYEACDDVYELGLLLHELSTGRNLHGSVVSAPDFWLRLSNPEFRREEVSSALPPSLRFIIETACAHDRSQRPANGAALLSLFRLPPPARPQHATASEIPVGNRPPRVTWRLPGTLVFLLFLVAAWMVSTEIGKQPSSGTASLFDEARDWVRFPGGFSLVLGPHGARASRWQLSVDGRVESRGVFEPVGGGRGVVVTNLSVTGEAQLDVFDGERCVGRERFQFPSSVFEMGPRARFGLDSFQLTWRLHGRGRVTVVVAREGDERLERQHVRQGTCIFAVDRGGMSSRKVSYRLEHRGVLLAESEGKVGLSSRAERLFPTNALRRLLTRSSYPVSRDDRIFVELGRGNCICFEPQENPSGPRLVPSWVYTANEVGADGQLPWKGKSALLAMVGDGSGKLLLVEWCDGPRFLLLTPTRQKQGPFGRLYPLLGEYAWPCQRPYFNKARLLPAASGMALFVSWTIPPRQTVVGLVDPAWRVEHPRLEFAGRHVLDVVGRASRFFLCWGEGRRALGTLVEVAPNTRPVVLWEEELPGPPTPEDREGASVALCTSSSGDRALVVYGTTAHVVDLAGSSTSGLVRSMALPIAEEARVISTRHVSDNLFVVAVAIPTSTIIEQPPRVSLLAVDTTSPSGSVIVCHAPSRLMQHFKVTTNDGLLVHGDRIYLVLGHHLFVFRNEPTPFFICELYIADPAAIFAPFVVANSLFCTCRDGTFIGFDFID